MTEENEVVAETVEDLADVENTEEEVKVITSMEFSLVLAEIPVTLTEIDGTPLNLILCEISGKQRDAYMQNMSSRSKVDGKGNPVGNMNFDGFQAHLLTLCLKDRDNRKPLSKEKIQSFPSKVQEALFNQAQQMSGLNVKAGEEAKND